MEPLISAKELWGSNGTPTTKNPAILEQMAYTKGTPEEFLKIYIKEMNDKQKEIEIENGKKYLHKENK